MRSDSILNTGINGASAGKAERAKEARDLRKLIKEDKRAKLKPHAEIIMAELDKELEETKLALLKAIVPSTPEENVKSVIVSLNLYEESVKKLKSRLKNILRGFDEN